MRMKTLFIFRDESGVVLVIALLMMVVLTLIGISSVYTSIFEIKHSGNIRASAGAFYSADSGVQVVVANVGNFNVPGKYSNNKYDLFSDPNNPNPTKAKVTIQYDTTQEGPPQGSGFSAINFEFEHFVIGSTGRDQMDLSIVRSACSLEQKVVKVVPTLQGGY